MKFKSDWKQHAQNLFNFLIAFLRFIIFSTTCLPGADRKKNHKVFRYRNYKFTIYFGKLFYHCVIEWWQTIPIHILIRFQNCKFPIYFEKLFFADHFFDFFFLHKMEKVPKVFFVIVFIGCVGSENFLEINGLNPL